MSCRLLDFERLSSGNPLEDEFWKWRYKSFWDQVAQQILDSWKSVHYILSNIASLRGVLWKRYQVRKLNNAFQKTASLEELKGRVRLEQIQVVVIDAVNGFIEVSQET